VKYYITTPIYYINDIPHIGHAYTTIAADVLARYHRRKGDEVFFLTGTDEHGAKIAEAAEKAGKSPQDFADSLVPKFEQAWKAVNSSYDQFFRTTNPEHEKLVSEFVAKLIEKGFVEKRKYEGLYCVGCEKFLKEGELVDGLCSDHKKAPVKQAEENYFFKLSDPAISTKLAGLINNNELIIEPDSRRNEVLGKIKQGLEDISISRAGVKWGIPFPGDPSQTIYVWVDALLNYYTATKIYFKEAPTPPSLSLPPHLTSPQAGEGTLGRGGNIWPADLHLIGKDILWFHAVIWPAMLIVADLPVPKKVFAHGFFTVDGQKMSKTVGNVIDPNEVVKKFGADAVRYALLREFPFGEDGDISVEKIEKNYNDLANNIGNLLQRTIAMLNRYAIKPNNELGIMNHGVDAEIEGLNFMGALIKIDNLAIETNKYIAEKEPWTLAKENKTEELTEVLGRAYTDLNLLAELLEPFMPETAEKMNKQLETLEPEPLFPRLEK